MLGMLNQNQSAVSSPALHERTLHTRKVLLSSVKIMHCCCCCCWLLHLNRWSEIICSLSGTPQLFLFLFRSELLAAQPECGPDLSRARGGQPPWCSGEESLRRVSELNELTPVKPVKPGREQTHRRTAISLSWN